jgi:hypothetical protein
MPRGHPVDLLRDRLLGGTDFEITGSDRETGVGYRVSVRRGDVDTAAFSRIDPVVLQSSIEAGLPLSIGASLYRVERSFGPTFLHAVREAARVPATSATVQSNRQIVTVIGGEPLPTADALKDYVPTTLEWADDTLDEGSREIGRKVGHAAKDLAGLREATFGLEHLQTLERSGEAEAYEAVRKQVIWPAPSLDALRAKDVPPAVAFGIVSCWRMLRQRPARNPASRLAFVRDLPALREALERCRTLDAFIEVTASYMKAWSCDAAKIVGNHLACFARRLEYLDRSRYGRDATRRNIFTTDASLSCMFAIDAIREVEDQWSAADQALSNHGGSRKPGGLPLPVRPSLPLEQLRRSGQGLPDPPAIERVSVELGITGLEFGNYVSRREGERLARLTAEAFTDLRHLLGDWVVPLCRQGNLSVALGSRGKGKSCAHYEPALRVINLTKSRGDGSLAHEFAHFLDHMIAAHEPKGESRYLSARVTRIQRADHPIAAAMKRAMQAISVTPHRERVTGEVNPGRWFLKGWITGRDYDPELPPQEAFDRVADREPATFRHGRNSRASSITLVHSIAKFRKSPVEVEIAFEAKTDFVRNAKQLGVYWGRPEELFARAFESFVEDEATHRSWYTQYLVSGTQRDYTGCRGLPYPTGGERGRIGLALRELVEACAAEEGPNSYPRPRPDPEK